MVCQMCKKNEANIVIVKVVGLNKTKFHVCNECANYLLGNTVSSFSFSKNNLNEILFSVLSTFSKYSGEENILDSKMKTKCPNCSLTYDEFTESGKIGCSRCYNLFRKQIKPLLSRLHGNNQHIGKVPSSLKVRLNQIKTIKQIRENLSEAISKEEYEKAAILRDQIIEEEKRAGIKNEY